LKSREENLMEESSLYVGGYAYQKMRKLGLSDNSARTYSKLAKISSFNSNEVIWDKGSDVNAWHCIITGLVVASVHTDNSPCTPIALYGESSWFGEYSILNHKPSYANFVSLVSTDVLSLSNDVVLELLEKEPGFAICMAKMMSWRAQKTSEMLMMMKLGNPCLRVVMGICQFAETLAYNADRPPTIGYGEGVTIPLIQSVLASLCGVSRTRLSEFAHHLAMNGWLRISYGKVEILSLNTWHKFATLQRERKFNNLNPTIEELLADLLSCDSF